MSLRDVMNCVGQWKAMLSLITIDQLIDNNGIIKFVCHVT